MLGSLAGYSQSQAIQPCNTYQAMEERFKADPQARKSYEESQEKAYQEYLAAQKNNANGKTAATVYTVPVVFHILHQGGVENISDQTCITALNQINSDLAAAGPDASLVAAPYSSLYVNSDIKLMLAHKDPSGNCTSGIVHYYDSRTNWNQGNVGSNYTGITWDPTKYLNIIIVKQIIPTGTVTGGGIIVGYTYKPGTWPSGALQDAVVYNYGFLTGLQARSLTHECGHWFNLSHTFGNTNNPGVSCGDDAIGDTPKTKGNFSTCPSSLSGNTCETNGQQNVENIMDYSSCPRNFTQGQTTVMRNALASATSGRSNLSSPTNLTATDVNGTATCAPVADFLSTTNTFTVCSGGSLTLKDFSYNGAITSYSWAGDNGVNFAAPTASQTSATFPNQGVVNVTLTVSNGTGSSSKVRTVTVLNGVASIGLPYSEPFEASSTTPAGWVITNPNPGSVTWSLTNTASTGTGLNSFYLDGVNATVGQVDYLQMPMIDLNTASDTAFSFMYAYARANTSNVDLFKVEASKDCGGTWGTLFNPSAASMASGSGGTTSTPFVPTLSQWKYVNLVNYPNWVSYSNSSSVLIRFSFTENPGGSGAGNRLYIDDINFLGSSVGINEYTKIYRFNLFPNPANGEANVSFNLNDAASVKLEVVDVVGKQVIPATSYNFGAGEQTLTINKNKSLPTGIYFVNLSINGTKMSKKLIIQ